MAPWDPNNALGPPPNMDPAQAEAWRERERRQRTIRLLMMFMLMLLLMDSEEQAGRKRSELLKQRNKKPKRYQLSPDVFETRQAQDHRLQSLTQHHPRYAALTEKNNGKNVPEQVLSWATQHAEIVKDEFVDHSSSGVGTTEPQEPKDPEEKNIVFHYPWNTTGFYRGEWKREVTDEKLLEEGSDRPTTESPTIRVVETSNKANDAATITNKATTEIVPVQYLDAQALEIEMRSKLQNRKDPIGISLLPAGKEVILKHDTSNFTKFDWNRFSSLPPQTDADHYFMHIIPAKKHTSVEEGSGDDDESDDDDDGDDDEEEDNEEEKHKSLLAAKNPSLATSHVTLTKPSGRAAFQLFSRAVPGMHEISLVDGFLKLYDSNILGYSTHKDILLRVRGVLIHAIGRVSLVANANHGRSVLVLSNPPKHRPDDTDAASEEAFLGHRRRRLEEILSGVDKWTDPYDLPMEQIREDAVALFGSNDILTGEDRDEANVQFKLQSLPDDLALEFESDNREERARHRRRLAEAPSIQALTTKNDKKKGREVLQTHGIQTWSDFLIPFPFVLDDENGTIRNMKTAAARKMPPREQSLEQNAGVCEFEVTMDTKEVEWTIGDWRKLLERRVRETMGLDPKNKPLEPEKEDSDDKERKGDKRHRLSSHSSAKSSRSPQVQKTSKPIQDEALLMSMTGKIISPNCNFEAFLNVTALRTDWEHTTTKAINYSFYMMLTCLTQIMVLLRQLLHTQARSTATRVSLLCIGWQTMIDAILCLGHIYLSLAIKPLFTAFASVAFFKWLIFCFIEMKYWTLIVQSRNSSNSTEQLRRQVALLHCRFYGALFIVKVLFSLIGDKHRILFALALYSFWIPQIVQNIITEAKRPMHNWYIYGMSISRMVAPVYFFAVPNNFLKEVYPESPTDPLMCELLILWVGIQTAVLIGQGKYGARFMIPARFLPPKFDYSRPIPASILPPGVTQEVLPEPQSRTSRALEVSESQSLLANEEPVVQGRRTTTRNRIRGSRLNRQENTMTAEPVVNDTSTGSGNTLDCVICYNAIDVHDRRGYMLAPCDHIFHKDCLVQWMDVKMECPICRTELPAL